jgi:protein TonB
MNALLAGAPHPPGFESHHLKIHARAHFRHGLILSAALHLGLLALFLTLTRGHEDAVRLYSAPAIVLKPPVWHPPLPNPPPGRVVTGTDETGVIVPKKMEFDPREFTPDTRGVGAPEKDPGPPANNPGATESAPPVPDDGGFPVSMVQVPPIPIDTPKPKYPERAREIEITGRVLLHALVGADGSVIRVIVKSGVNGLNEAAVEAIYRWRYKPALMNGRPVPVWLEIPVNFTLR